MNRAWSQRYRLPMAWSNCARVCGREEFPSSAGEGWPRHQENIAIASFEWSGRGGAGREIVFKTTPPRLRAIRRLRRSFLMRASTPPRLRKGMRIRLATWLIWTDVPSSKGEFSSAKFNPVLLGFACSAQSQGHGDAISKGQSRCFKAGVGAQKSVEFANALRVLIFHG